MRRYTPLACLTILLALGTTYGAEARRTKITPQMIQMYREIMLANQQADDDLYKQMQDVAVGLRKYSARGYFPQGAEASHVESKLEAVCKTNPYKAPEPAPDPEITEEMRSAPPPPPPRVKIYTDLSLREDRMEDYLESSGSWTDEPGTISAIGGGDRLILLWGAGADRKPIRDAQSGKLRVVVTRF